MVKNRYALLIYAGTVWNCATEALAASGSLAFQPRWEGAEYREGMAFSHCMADITMIYIYLYMNVC